MVRLIGFDLDDTLIHTQHYYSLVQAQLIKHIITTLGPKSPAAPTILELQVQKDMEGVRQKGFVMERFPESFYETYLEIANKLRVNNPSAIEGAKEAYQIAMRVFNPDFWVPHLIPGAERTLEALAARGDELFLLTTGDPRVQSVKVERYELEKWFGPNIHIVPHHKKEKLAEITSKKDKGQCWFVGNSAKSDIKPALELGLGAVYIPQETWAYDNHDLSTSSTIRLNQLDKIEEIILAYDSLK